MSDINNKIGKFWSAALRQVKNDDLKIRWWQSPLIIKHVNRLVYGKPVDGFSQGLINKIKKDYSNRIPFGIGISIGCGTAQKEINLVKQGIVKNFDLFELIEERIIDGERLIKKNKLEKHLRYIRGDAFEIVKESEKYDLVPRNNSLHHMLNVYDSVSWSKNVLKKGGLFYMDDFIGASHFQWTDKQLSTASRVRRIFSGSKYLVNPKNVQGSLDIDINRPNRETLIENDPSEAADSENIISSIKTFFPGAEIIKTGGVVYSLVLTDMLHNFDEKNDKILLDLLMYIDELCIERNDSNYAVALAFKE